MSKNTSEVGVDSLEQRTSYYKKQLQALYSGYILLSAGHMLYSQTSTLEHECMFCGAIFSSKASTMLKGKGCTECRTQASHIQELEDHIETIDEIHNKQFLLQPRLLPTFSKSFGLLYKCQICKRQHKIHPPALESKTKYKCPTCLAAKMKDTRTKNYSKRLELLYGSHIRVLTSFKPVKELLHECRRTSKPHKFKSTALDMLRGVGCPNCVKSTQNLQRQVEGFSYRQRKFVLRSKLEIKALDTAIKYSRSMEYLETAYSHPIPILGKKHVTAFFDKNHGEFIEVFRNESFIKKCSTMTARIKEAEKLGFVYAAIFVSEEDNTPPAYFPCGRLVELIKKQKAINAKFKANRQKKGSHPVKKASP